MELRPAYLCNRSMKSQDPLCDPETGECTPAEVSSESPAVEEKGTNEIIYVGDPMCSWCWGISNHLKKLKAHFSNFKFTVVVGGLRPGGGDPWDDQFKNFLKHHWKEVNERSRQPFGYTLFDREKFNYDTEPACRAVVVARDWISEMELEFFEAVSRKFYVENSDPTEVVFYASICEKFEIPFEDFSKKFQSDEARLETNQDFMLGRNWGVTSYPTVVLRHNDELFQINRGYTEFEMMKRTVENIKSSTITS